MSKTMIASKRAAIVFDKFHEFQGPDYEQNGKLRVPEVTRTVLREIPR